MTPSEKYILHGLFIHFKEAYPVCLRNSLDSECFSDMEGKWFYETIAKMNRDNEDVDEISLYSKIESSSANKVDLIQSYMDIIQTDEPIISGYSYMNAVASAVSMKIDDLRHEACMVFHSINPNSSNEDIVQVEKSRSSILEKIKKYHIVDNAFDSSVDEALQEVEMARRKETPKPAFTMDFWPSFSSEFYDIMSHELVTIGARPGAGKTSMLTNIVGSALNQGSRCFIGTFEMTMKELAKLIAGQIAKVNCTKLAQELENKLKIYEQYLQWQRELYSDGLLGFSEHSDIEQFEADVENFACKKGRPNLILVDYLQLMKWQNGGNLKKHEMLGECSLRLKGMTKRYKCPVIAAAQLNRDYTKEGKLPTKEDLKDSGRIEEDSDRVLLLHQEKNNQDGEDQTFNWLKDITVIQGKCRAGPWAKKILKFNGPQRRFYEQQ